MLPVLKQGKRSTQKLAENIIYLQLAGKKSLFSHTILLYFYISKGLYYKIYCALRSVQNHYLLH